MPRCRTDEEGMASLLGLCLLVAVLLMGMTLLYAGRSQAEMLARFQDEWQLRRAAESGLLQASMKLAESRCEDVPDAPAAACIHEEEYRSGLQVRVYASRRTYAGRSEEDVNDAIDLVSRARHENSILQSATYHAAFGYMKREGDHYVWGGWLPGYEEPYP